MNDRHRRLEELFSQALDLAPGEVDAFIDRECADDAVIRAELLDLLKRDQSPDRPGTFPLIENALLEGTLRAPGLDTPEQIGRYPVLGVLGRGGMGEVLSARDPELDRTLALKVLPAAVFDDPKRVENFQREAQLLAALNHPNIATIYSFESDGPRHFLTMEWVDGEDLSKRIEAGPVPFEEGLQLARQMASALEAAHSRRIVHLDFKPKNVMLTSEDVVKVLDFGIAKTVGEEAPSGDTAAASPDEAARSSDMAVSPSPSPSTPGTSREATPIRSAGTPGYMSPEQIRGERIGPPSDTWAWACTVFAMLTGEQPFAGKTIESRAAATLRDEPPWERLPAGVSARVRTLLETCLQKMPSDRPASMADVRRVLDEEIEARVRARVLAEAAREGGSPDADAPTHHIPERLSSFVGRSAEIAEAVEQVRAHRMVSLIGFGGCGKTRLAEEVGRRSLADLRDGVWFAELAPATGSEWIGPAILAALRIPGSPREDAMELAISHLRRREALLILDNCEHLVTDAAAAAKRLLAECPDLRILVTSREPLRIEGEQVLTVRPMEVPEVAQSQEVTAAVLAESEAVQLFCERARAAQPRFELTDANAGAVLELCRRLDGIPLALELAGARMRALPLTQLVQRLNDRFRILTGGRRGGLPHHETLRAAIDWSHEQLTAREQRFFARLSVFVGGWTLEAAEAVGVDAEPGDASGTASIDTESGDASGTVSIDREAGDGPASIAEGRIEAWQGLDLLTSLVEKSLVQFEPRGDRDHELPPRYAVLETVQAYAAEKLDVDGPDERARVEARHGAFFAAWGSESALDAIDQDPGGYPTYAADFENLESACRRALALGDHESSAHAYLAATMVFKNQGPAGVAVDLGLQVLDNVTRPTLRAQVLFPVGEAERILGKMDAAREHWEAALAIHREEGNRRWEGIVLGRLGVLDQMTGRMDAALERYSAALTVLREVKDRQWEAVILGNLGALHGQHGRMDAAREQLEAAVLVHREMGDRRSEGIVLGNLGNLHADQGRIGVAREHYEAALILHREVGDRRSEGLVLSNLGTLHADEGRMDIAGEHYEAALVVHREVGDWGSEGTVLGNLGDVHQDQGRMEAAREHQEAALAIHREVGNRLGEGHTLGRLGALNGMEGRVEEARRCFAESVEVIEEVNDPFELASVLAYRGMFELEQGEGESAKATLEEVESVAERCPLDSNVEIAKQVEAFRRAVGVGE